MNKLLLTALALSVLMVPCMESTNTPSSLEVIRYQASFTDVNPPELPSEFGERGLEFTLNNAYYINYERGYARATIDTFGEYIFKLVGGKNISETGDESFVSLDKMLEIVGDKFINDTFSFESVTKVLGARVTQEKLNSIAAKFKVKYTEYYNKGFNLGIRNSDIKAWDGAFITQDFRYGDGSFAFDSNRINMSFLMYNSITDTVHLLTNKQAEIWNGHKEELGLPCSDLESKTIKLPNQSNEITTNLQTFDRGFMYGTGSSYTYVTGYEYNAETNEFIAVPNPITSSNYGSLIKTIEKGDEIIFAYEYAIIKAKLVNGTYTYEYLPGRILNDDEETYTMMPLSQCLSWVGDAFDSDYNGKESHISELLKEKYTELYNAGYFCGFKESDFHGNWNNVDAQQFINSDSSACPWEGTRVNVSALVYNEAADKIVLLKDSQLILWNKNYNGYGAPVEDAFEDEEGNIYQQFENGLLVLIKGQSDLSFLFDGNYEEYIIGRNEYEKPSYGQEYTVTLIDNRTPMIIGITIPAVVVVAGLAFVMILLNKKKKKNASTGE